MKWFSPPLLSVLLFLVLLSGCGGRDITGVHEEAYRAYQMQDYRAAAEKFEILVQEMPADGELWFRLGNSYARSKMPQQAIGAYQNALLRDPAIEKAWFNMGLIHLHAALKAFVDMQNYVDDETPVGKRGKMIREELFGLLGSGDGDEKKE